MKLILIILLTCMVIVNFKCSSSKSDEKSQSASTSKENSDDLYKQVKKANKGNSMEFKDPNYPPANVKPEDFVEGKDIKVAGRLRMIGNAPFTELVLTPLTNFDINLEFSSKEEQKKYMNLQYKFLELTGKAKVKEILMADKKTKITKYIIKIETVEVLQ